VVTGPGGVLWGANSFLGIMNVISKDASDINGLEVSAGYGDGPGNKEDIRAYAMFGKTFFGGKLKIFQHVSYENFIGPMTNHPEFLAGSPSPQPIGPSIYGAYNGIEPARSWLLTIDGKYSLGPFTLFYQVPVGDMHPGQTFNNTHLNQQMWNIYERYAVLAYKDRFFGDRFGLTARAYYTEFVRRIDTEVIVQSSLYPSFTAPDGSTHFGGVHFDDPHMLVQRVGGTVDTDLNLPHGLRLLIGGEAFYDSLTGGDTYLSTQPNTDLASPSSVANLPIYCPRTANGDGSYTPVSQCPRLYLIDSSRTTVAAYGDLQWRPVRQLTLDGGVRLQKGLGQFSYDLTPLYTASLVWNFINNLHVKLNYATGFRAPVFQDTSAPPGGLEFAANPHLQNETSQAFQGELNARLLHGVKQIRELELRLDYSYTYLDNLIQIHASNYGNTGKRAIHSVEGYGKLYLNGDHFLVLAYTFLHTTAIDVGVVRAVPNHTVSLGGSFNLVKRLLDVNANLIVTGAYTDPDRYPSGRAPIADGTTVATTTDITFDRLTPVALLQLGFRLRFLQDRMGLSAQFYNVLNQRYYVPDPFYDLAPTTETQPTMAPGFNFFASMTYRL
jgi:outer membrane receptor protein involved in Fe transport